MIYQQTAYPLTHKQIHTQ